MKNMPVPSKAPSTPQDKPSRWQASLSVPPSKSPASPNLNKTRESASYLEVGLAEEAEREEGAGSWSVDGLHVDRLGWNM